MAIVTVAGASGCSKGPYSCQRVSGKVTYEDGSLIPAKRISLTFFPQVTPIDPHTHPKPAGAEVDVKTGNFSFASTYASGDGIIDGEHKVTVQCFLEDRRLRTDLVPDEYSDKDKTPLSVRSSDSPFQLLVRKPSS